MRVRGFGAARTYDAADRILAGPRELRIVVHKLSGGQRLSVSRAPQTLHSPRAPALRPLRSVSVAMRKSPYMARSRSSLVAS